MNHKNLVFLGTSHIAKQSLEEVAKHIEEGKPDIIALELDAKRLNALMSEKKNIGINAIRRIGLKGFLFSLFGAWAERKLGKLVGVKPGAEMKQAVKLAKKNNISIALIDQDIETTLQRLSKAITYREKFNFLADLVKAFFVRKSEIDFDLTKVPDKKTIKKLTDKLKARYPNFYKVLIEERNIAIANNLSRLIQNNPDKKILVILGAGHVDDVAGLLKKEESRITYRFSVS